MSSYIKSGSEKGSFGKGSFEKSPCLEILKILEILELRDSREPPDCGKRRKIRSFYGDSTECRDLDILQIRRPLSS